MELMDSGFRYLNMQYLSSPPCLSPKRGAKKKFATEASLSPLKPNLKQDLQRPKPLFSATQSISFLSSSGLNLCEWQRCPKSNYIFALHFTL